ncbi:hypothetical protein ACTS95_14810 [Empedobacter brevis]
MRVYSKQSQFYNNRSHVKLSTSINGNEYLIIYTGWNIMRYTNKEQFKKDLKDTIRTLGLEKVEIGTELEKYIPIYLRDNKTTKIQTTKKQGVNSPIQLELF